MAKRKRKQLPEEYTSALEQNKEYVESYFKSNITYTRKFYKEMYRLIMQEKKTAKEAYELLGFDTAIFGEDRAKAAAQRAKEMAGKDGRFSVSPGKYNGSISADEMGSFDDPEEQIAYLKARMIYLETVLDAEKKTNMMLETMESALKGLI